MTEIKSNDAFHIRSYPAQRLMASELSWCTSPAIAVHRQLASAVLGAPALALDAAGAGAGAGAASGLAGLIDLAAIELAAIELAAPEVVG